MEKVINTPKSVVELTAYDSPCGRLILGSYQGRLCLCDWATRFYDSEVESRIGRTLKAKLIEQASEVTQETMRQLEEYFQNERKTFDLPLMLVGTEFQRRVWEELNEIPYGATCSYAELAASIGRPRATRAVAHAVGANAISIIVPCHRIVGSNGNLTGYAGGLAAKRFLLGIEMEQVAFFHPKR